jgi:D-serine deaminase-like pyridoxal phosphate-dependent protein
VELPRLLLNLSIAEQNIQLMAQKAETAGVEFRPHFKTHQSRSIGSLFRKHGVKGITVSSLRMARYFLADGWKDITVAFPSPVHEMDNLNAIPEDIEISLLLSDEQSSDFFDDHLKRSFGVYIEINSGQNRSGWDIDQMDTITTLAEHISQKKKLNFKGFYCHSGQTYRAGSAAEVRSITESVLDTLSKYRNHFPDVHICFGDTPSCSISDFFGPVSQISPGNFVFYDLMQVGIGAADYAQIAVMMECPIVELHPDRSQVLIHGGAIHFSKDYMYLSGNKVFGLVASDWGKPLPGNYLISLSQEHGLVECTPDFMKGLKIGDTLKIFPVHSCLTANLMGSYSLENGKQADHMNKPTFE